MGDSIRRMLRKIGTNKLWSSHSLKGRKNAKKPFQNLKLASVSELFLVFCLLISDI